VFGLGLTELLVLLIVGVVVVGPKKLPEMMRTAGRWVAKLRRMSTDLRAQSGIDEILRAEGLEKEIRELRSLSRINVMDSLLDSTTRPRPALPARVASSTGGGVPSGGVADAAAAPAGAAASGPAVEVANAPPRRALDGSNIPGSVDAVRAGRAAGPPGAPPPGAIGASPANGAVPRASATSAAAAAPVALVGDEPLPDREYPPWGCDAYDALPDDLDDEEEAPAAAGDAPAQAAPPGAA
jgi:sec-independent protein translocase protein TatB